MSFSTTMTPSDPTARFLPTLERARAAQLPLPPGEPLEQERWSALFLLAAIMQRTTWTEVVTQHPDGVAHLGRGTPDPPANFTGARWVAVESMSPLFACQACSLTPGLRLCRVCRGSGEVLANGVQARCSCKGGQVACPTCSGHRLTARVVLRYFDDSPKLLREFLLPSHLPCHAPLFHLESTMEEVVNLALPPPEDLRCQDLTGRSAGSAYRGGERIVRPTFHGHDFGDTIDRSLETLKAFGGGAQVVRHEVRAYAWPLLQLRYPNEKNPAEPRQFAVFPDREGALQLFGE